MSYCRWSTDDFQCDVYVYADIAGGYTTHVAGNRVVYQEPLPPHVSYLTDLEGWLERHRKVMEMIENSPREEITLPHAGETFNDPTPQACANRLQELKSLGYVVPQCVIDDLRMEKEEAES